MSRKIYILILAIFGLGVIVGYCIHGLILRELDPIVRSLLGVGASLGVSAGLMVQVISTLRDHFNKKREIRTQNNKLIVKDIQSWMEIGSSLMAHLEYREGHIIHGDSGDPKALPYYEETKIHLEAYNALTLWEKAKSRSQHLKDKGKTTLEQFDKKLADAVSDLQLARSDVPNWDGRIPYCNLTRIKEAVFVEVDCRIKGKRYYNQFNVLPSAKHHSLTWGETVLARGDEETLNCIKNRIEELINNSDVRKKVKIYEEIRNEMAKNVPLEQFRKKLINEIVNPFSMNVPLKGKCRFC